MCQDPTGLHLHLVRFLGDEVQLALAERAEQRHVLQRIDLL